MILVTGTKRSGTSMWMQVLVAGGIPVIGEDFSTVWKQSIERANPKGFYESVFRQGVFYATNPDPVTQEWLHPDAVRGHAVKVFIPGVVRTEFSYIQHAIVTMRDWRTYGASLEGLYALEDTWLAGQENGEKRLEAAKRTRSRLPPAVEWWMEYHDLLRDIAIRRYPVNVSSYDRMLRDPQSLIERVFRWLGQGDPKAALTAVEPSLRRTAPVETVPDGLEPEHIEVFDELYARIDREQPLEPAFLEKANAVRVALEDRFGALSRDRQRLDESDISP
ncbi:MAG: hypothetical protein R3F61_12950 [Myxococcota bacterium]